MALSLTSDMLVRAYEFLRTTEPFRLWRMPHADEVSFSVDRNREWLGCFYVRAGAFNTVPHINISDKCVGHTDTLMRAMAHEMIHLVQWYKQTANRAAHNADFRVRADRVCRAHGWDPKLFV